MTKVTDEMLMAYVDGELDGPAADDVRRATESDTELARRAESFRASRSIAREALAGIRAEPVPERLIQTVLGSANTNIVPARRYWALPLAASVAIMAGLAGYWLALQSTPGSGDLFGNRQVAEALGNTPSGRERAVQTAGGTAHLKTVATYQVEGGLCRTFELAGGSQTVRGVGCSQNAEWRVSVAVAMGDSGSFAPASSGAPAAVEAFLDALDARGPLSAEEEAALAKGAR